MVEELNKNGRLLFLDTLRAIAIVFMLQGHFIGVVLEFFSHYKHLYFTEGSSGYFIFDFWFKIKVYTAPLFFMISGIVFVYLLTKKPEASYRKKRLKKGVLRSLKLIITGYLLQINLIHLNETFTSDNPWLFAFHVLQCIGVGILLLCLICFIHYKLNFGKLWIWYLLAFISCVVVYLNKDWIVNNNLFIHSPQIIRNTIEGPYAIFPVIPWLAFIFFGGCIGATLKRVANKIQSPKYIRIFIFSGLVLHLISLSGFIRYIDINLHEVSLNSWGIYKILWIFRSIGLNLFLVGFTNWLLKSRKIQSIPFAFLGKDTLLIYNLHVILLYGGFFGIGIDLIWKEQLSPIASIIGAIGFIGFFYVVTFAHQKVKKIQNKQVTLPANQP